MSIGFTRPIDSSLFLGLACRKTIVKTASLVKNFNSMPRCRILHLIHGALFFSDDCEGSCAV